MYDRNTANVGPGHLKSSANEIFDIYVSMLQKRCNLTNDALQPQDYPIEIHFQPTRRCSTLQNSHCRANKITSHIIPT